MKITIINENQCPYTVGEMNRGDVARMPRGKDLYIRMIPSDVWQYPQGEYPMINLNNGSVYWYPSEKEVVPVEITEIKARLK